MNDKAETHDQTEPDPLDLARSIMRGLAGKTAMRRRASRTKATSGLDQQTYSGAHPDPRDPQPLDVAIKGLIAEGDWSEELRVHGIFARWSALVGEDIAAHAKPISLHDGRLEIQTETTAWATQLRLFVSRLLRQLNEELGDGTVTVIEVRGPNAPSWSRGKRRVKGRGPRDTYG